MPEIDTGPLIWGQGKRRFEMFLEPTCPFSATAFAKLDDLADRADGVLEVQVWIHSQPWHLLSPIVTRAIFAAGLGGADMAKGVMAAIYDQRERFAFDDHGTGPNRTATPDDILERIAEVGGVPVARSFDDPDLDKAVKRHTRYARQNGIHESPSFMIDGLLRADVSSGDPVDDWIRAAGI